MQPDALTVNCATGCADLATVLPVGAALPSGYMATLQASAGGSLLVTDRQANDHLRSVIALLFMIMMIQLFKLTVNLLTNDPGRKI